MDSPRKQYKKGSKGGSTTAETSVQEFTKWKALSTGKVDLSKKGSVDEQIGGLVGYINDQIDYFTTSSCSGRILVCSDDPLQSDAESNGDIRANSKRDCVWYFVSHTSVDPNNIAHILENIDGPSKFKFEPFVLHVQCRTLKNAKVLHRAAFEAGFRNSGITFGKGGRKIIAAVRGTACLEAPMTDVRGSELTTDSYVNYIARMANQKLERNFRMISQFEKNLTSSLQVSLEPPRDEFKEVYRRRGKLREKDSCHPTVETDVDSSCLFDA